MIVTIKYCDQCIRFPGSTRLIIQKLLKFKWRGRDSSIGHGVRPKCFSNFVYWSENCGRDHHYI